MRDQRQGRCTKARVRSEKGSVTPDHPVISWLFGGDPVQHRPAWHGRAGCVRAGRREAEIIHSDKVPGCRNPGEQLQQMAHRKGKSNWWIAQYLCQQRGPARPRPGKIGLKLVHQTIFFQTLIKKTASSLHLSATVCCVSFTAPSTLQTQEQLVFAGIGSLC